MQGKALTSYTLITTYVIRITFSWLTHNC